MDNRQLKELRELKTARDLAAIIVDKSVNRLIAAIEHDMPGAPELFQASIERIDQARGTLSKLETWLKAHMNEAESEQEP